MNPLWIQQIRGVLRLELRKNLLGFRVLPIYLLAALPVLAIGVVVIVSLVFEPPKELESAAGSAVFFANIYQVFIIRFVVYFGCVWVFMNLIRGEVLDRSLHYYFLAPIRREVLVAAKYLSAVVTTTLLFSISTIICFVAIHAFPAAAGAFRGAYIGHLMAYVTATALGCLGYGALFLLIGLLFRNPIVPGIAIFLWEQGNFFLPGLLKKISLIFYLQSLFPVPIPDGPFAIIVEPVSIWLGVPGLLLFTAVALIIAGLRIRHMEIAYGAD